jgi:hypothetical protein
MTYEAGVSPGTIMARLVGVYHVALEVSYADAALDPYGASSSSSSAAAPGAISRQGVQFR